MDDPWGSPWATNDSNPSLEPPPRTSTTLELPGRLLTRNRSSSSISPWAVEEDAFNEWAPSDTGLALPPTAVANGPAWSGWGGDNGLNSSQTQLSVRTREGSLGQPSPSWPPAPSPGLHPSKTVSRRSSSRSLSRQPTPDPWAAEASEHRLSLPAAVHIAAEQAAFSTLDSHEELEESDLRESDEDGAHSAAAVDNEQVEDKPHNSEAEIEVESNSKFEDEPVVPAGTEDPGNNEDDHTGSPSLSRHSSVSNGSHQEERPDSPITSMDEDTKDRPQGSRRSSTKVQDMVELFDGMAKRKDSGTLLVPDPNGARRRSSARSVCSIRSAGTDAVSEFGDFEDAEAEGFESAVPSRQPSVSGSRPTSRASRLRSASKVSLRNAAAATSAIEAPSPIPEEPSKFEEFRAKFGLVTFTPDIESVDKLFDLAKLDKEQPPFKDYSLDTVEGIINDSFTAVSERKVWYRISRPGTMRKHDMGDDDNYRRVTWAGSKVKEDATKIVRRWMQEDTYYAGRPKAGNGPKIRGGGFDWDSNNSKVEALSFDEIFGKRKSVQTPKLGTAQAPRPLSLQAPAHSRNSSTGVKSLPPRSPLSIPAPPIAPAFGWSSGGSGASTPVSVRPPSLLRQSIEVNSTRSETSRRPSVQDSEGRSSLQLPPPPERPPSESSRTMTNPQPFKEHYDDDDKDDDDEWGEMVASPATDIRPASSFFEGSLNGSLASLAVISQAPAAPKMDDTSTTLNTAPSTLELNTELAPERRSSAPSATGEVDVWDFSAFDNTTNMPAIPPTTTSKPEFDFDTPLQSPTLSIPSRTSSPASIHTSKPPTPNIPQSRAGSPAFELPRAPTPPTISRPQHSAKSSLSLVRPSPLHHVSTPDLSSPDPVLPMNAPAKTVSFAEEVVDEGLVRQVVSGLPDLSYMLR
ncbi:hypothetical protein N0V93_006484 [Gnomoniopsis smithogilvyi]|uniref:Uncharacterized protein n=1 Tax=Gnomoniopsis smithogilvyi TaxID=1191159 RepID=A0A9W8YNA7_9PEZI|nr:hypothetical protein N0V93_006484 [Gnomoniopsis smithogilvyi]